MNILLFLSTLVTLAFASALSDSSANLDLSKIKTIEEIHNLTYGLIRSILEDMRNIVSKDEKRLKNSNNFNTVKAAIQELDTAYNLVTQLIELIPENSDCHELLSGVKESLVNCIGDLKDARSKQDSLAFSVFRVSAIFAIDLTLFKTKFSEHLFEDNRLHTFLVNFAKYLDYHESPNFKNFLRINQALIGRKIQLKAEGLNANMNNIQDVYSNLTRELLGIIESIIPFKYGVPSKHATRCLDALQKAATHYVETAPISDSRNVQLKEVKERIDKTLMLYSAWMSINGIAEDDL